MSPITHPPPFVLEQAWLAVGVLRERIQSPTLWGVKYTAPYFHDNSAKDLDEMLVQYDWSFLNQTIGGRMELAPPDKVDIKAFLRLL